MSVNIPLKFKKLLFDNLPYVSPFEKKIGYIGWAGHDNLGDDAILLASELLFRPLKLLPYKRTNKIELFEKVIKRKIFSAILFGGGTLLNAPEYLDKLKIAKENYNKVFIFGSGVRNPEFWQQFGPKSNCLLESIEWLRKCDFLSVRGPISKQILEKSGLSKVEVTGDTVLFLARDSMKNKEFRKKIGINIGTSFGKQWGSEEGVMDFIVKYSSIMHEKGWDITFLPVFKKDISYIEETVRRIGKDIKIFNDFNSIHKTLNLLESFDIFIGEKLHSVVLAMCVSTPSIMLEYRPKCLDFMMSMGLEKFNIRTDNLHLDRMLSLSTELYKNINDLQKEIFYKANFYKNIQKERSKLIVENIIGNN